MNLEKYDSREQFDLIVSRDALEHIMDLEGLLREVIKRLKPGGGDCMWGLPRYGTALMAGTGG